MERVFVVRAVATVPRTEIKLLLDRLCREKVFELQTALATLSGPLHGSIMSEILVTHILHFKR